MSTTTKTNRPIRDFPLIGKEIGRHIRVEKDGRTVVDKKVYFNPNKGKKK